MNTHRLNRTLSKSSGLRRWLIGTLTGANSHIDSRRLLCEQLERRYALHGMDWFEESVDRFEYSETIIVDDPVTSARFTAFQAWEGELQSRGRPQPKLRDSFAHGEDATFDAFDADAFDEWCDHSHGLRPEAEGPSGRATIERGLADVWKLTSKPEPKIDSLLPSRNTGKSETPTLAIVKDFVSSLESPAKNTLTQDHPPTQSATSSTSVGVTAGNREAPIFRVVDLTGSARSGGAESSSSVSNNSVVRSTPNAPATSLAALRSASPSLTTAQTDVSASVAQTNVASRTSLNSGTASLVQSANGTKESATSPANAWQRNSSESLNENKSKIDNATEGLLSELRAVIEKLANDLAGEKASLDASRQHNSSPGKRIDVELFGLERRAKLFDDGMLELAATDERLASNSAPMESIDSSSSELQHRSQLLASLELNREFELAGQSFQTLKRVIDPTAKVQEASLAAEEAGNGHDQFSTAAGLSANAGNAESSLWQRSILPLSFMAIGGLLIRSRKKYRAIQPRK